MGGPPKFHIMVGGAPARRKRLASAEHHKEFEASKPRKITTSPRTETKYAHRCISGGARERGRHNYKSLLKVRAKYVELLKIRKTETDKRDVRLGIKNLDEAVKDLRRPGRPTRLLRELDKLTDRERVLAQLARQQAKGADVLFHGTRHKSAVLRSGKLIPPKIGEQAIFFTRSRKRPPIGPCLWASIGRSDPQEFWC